MKEYRIRELNGKFDIEIKVVKIRYNFLFGKKITELWDITSSCGGALHYDYYTSIIPSKSFNTMREALEQIEQWNAKPIYHNISERCPNHDNGQETDDNSTSDTKA